MKHLAICTTHRDIVHPPSEIQAAVYTMLLHRQHICSIERMKLLILYTIHSSIVHSTKERRISSFKMKRADEVPMYT